MTRFWLSRIKSFTISCLSLHINEKSSNSISSEIKSLGLSYLYETYFPFSILHKFIPMQVEPFKDQIQRPSWKRACNYPVFTAACEVQDLPVLTIFIHSYTHSISGRLLYFTVSTTLEYFLKGIVIQPSPFGLILCPNILCTLTGIKNG